MKNSILNSIKLTMNSVFNIQGKEDLVTKMSRELYSAKIDLLFAQNSKEHAELAILMNNQRIARLEQAITLEVNARDITIPNTAVKEAYLK